MGWGPGVTCYEESLTREGKRHPQCDPSQASLPAKGLKKAEEASEASPVDHSIHTGGFSEGIT